MAPDPDPVGLIRESYRIEGIEPAECRSIFLDWALRLPDPLVPASAAAELLARYGAPPHPMTDLLREAASAPAGRSSRGPRRRR